jgi:hypothetical protein
VHRLFAQAGDVPQLRGRGGDAVAAARKIEAASVGGLFHSKILTIIFWRSIRWMLRDIKGKRTKFSPVRPDDLGTLTEMGLVQMKDDVPELTDEGHRALDLN